jgi:hypothetical protein
VFSSFYKVYGVLCVPGENVHAEHLRPCEYYTSTYAATGKTVLIEATRTIQCNQLIYSRNKNSGLKTQLQDALNQITLEPTSWKLVLFEGTAVAQNSPAFYRTLRFKYLNYIR